MKECARVGARRRGPAVVVAVLASCWLAGMLFAAPLTEGSPSDALALPAVLPGVEAAAAASANPEQAGSAAPLSVVAFQPICGEQRAVQGLSDDAVDEVRVNVTLRNPRRERVPAQNAELILRSAGGGESRRVLRVPAVAASRTVALEAAFPFPADLAASYVEVALVQAGEQSAKFAPISFGCVRKCPPHAVVVRLCRGGHCSDGAGEGSGFECAEAASHCEDRGRWVGELASCSRDRVYCSYTWETRGVSGLLPPAEPDLSVFDGADAEVDCSVISAQGPELGSGDGPLAAAQKLTELAELTGRQLEVPGLDAFLAQPNVPASQPVRLAVLDTAAVAFEAPAPNDNSEHGRLVGLIAERVACGDEQLGACPVRIDNRLALPIVELEREAQRWSMDLDYERGGYLAGRAQVAAAITDLLGDWRASAPANGERAPLVMNLSIGWHSKHDCAPAGCGDAIHVDRPSEVLVPDGLLAGLGSGDGDGPSQSLASEAILLAIARARCEGALVLAAAGNAVTDDEVGATLPGGWNRLPAARLDCDATFGIAHPGLAGGLVSAVAAVDYAGARTGLMRVGSLPPFTALGVAVAAGDERALLGVTGPRSGSSFATAVVSGAAARLWAHLGRSTPADEVARILYQGGLPLASGSGIDAQLCVGRGTCETESVQIGACSALRALAHLGRIPAASVPVECSVAAAPPPSSRGPVVLPELDADGKTLEEPERATVDILEASWVLPQPWGVKCATCQDQRITTSWPEWKGEFSGAYADGPTDLLGSYYRVSAGANDLSESIYGITVPVTGAIPAGQCTRYPDHCWRVQGTVYLYDWQNYDEAPARLEVEFVPDPATLTGEAAPFAADAITRLPTR